MTVQLRLAELMRRAGFLKDDGSGELSAYKLARAVDEVSDKVSEATIYRLVRTGGKVDTLKADTLDALAAVFGVEIPELFEKGTRRRKK